MPDGPRPHGLRRFGSLRLWLDRLTIRAVLLAGFSLILVLWIAAGLDVFRRLNEVERRAAAVRARLMQAEDLLSAVRAHVLLGSVYLRDALLDAPETGEQYRRRLEMTRAAIREALAGYATLIETAGERETLNQLEKEIEEYWEALLPLVSWDSARRATEARRILRERIIPRREVIIRISERIRALNRTATEAQQAQIARLYSLVRRRVWELGLEVLLIAALVAAIVTRHAGRLERRILHNTRILHRLSAQLVRAQEDERRTIARELHDEIGQELTGVKVELSVAERALEAGTRVANPLAEARAMTDRALQTVRNLSQLLHPPMLDDLGLVATLDWFVASFSRRTGIVAEFRHAGADVRLAPELEMCLYRLVQEATTNIARHAAARTCRVSLDIDSPTVRLLVQDDGRGFDPEEILASAGRGGLGLLGMRERVAGFDGRLKIDSESGKGTLIVVELPAIDHASLGESPPSSAVLIEQRKE